MAAIKPAEEVKLLNDMLDPQAKPGALVNGYRPFEQIWSDPIMQYMYAHFFTPNAKVHDRFGVEVLFPAGSPGPMPHVTADNKVCPDVTKWREYVHFPDIETICADGWDQAIADCEKAHEAGKLTLGFMPYGTFEQSHFLTGFTDMLVNLMIEPEATKELISAVAEFRFTYMKMLVDHLHPDWILSHDDWGSKDQLFMQPEIWRDMLKEPYEKMYAYAHDNGVKIMHHADSHCEEIVDDMVDMHIDIWQGVLPTNDIVGMQKRLQGKMILMGGIDSGIDSADQTEAKIRAEVRKVCETYGPGGHFIPSMSYGSAAPSIFPLTDPTLADEIDRYNVEHGFLN